VVEETYLATVEVEGPPGMQSVDARPSDALNLAALLQAPIFAAPAVLQEAEARRAGDSPTAARLRRALAACPMTVGTVELSGNTAEAPLLSVAAESPLPRNRMRSILTR